MLNPIRYPNCIMNSGNVGTLRECRLIFLNSFSVALIIRVNLSHQGMQLERVLIQGFQFFDRLNRSVLVNAGKLVKRVGILRIFSYCTVQLRNRSEEHTSELQSPM